MESWGGGLWDRKAGGRSPPNTVTENTWREMGTWRRTVTGRMGGGGEEWTNPRWTRGRGHGVGVRKGEREGALRPANLGPDTYTSYLS